MLYYFFLKLQDVVGHITALQDLEQITLSDGRIETKCDVYITDLWYRYLNTVSLIIIRIVHNKNDQLFSSCLTLQERRAQSNSLGRRSKRV